MGKNVLCPKYSTSGALGGVMNLLSEGGSGTFMEIKKDNSNWRICFLWLSGSQTFCCQYFFIFF